MRRFVKVCEITQARIIVPIHSEKPEAIESLALTGEVKILQDGESIMI